MNVLMKWVSGAAVAVVVGALPNLATAETAADLMKSRLGTTEVDPVIADAFARAARPVTPELRAKALECWNNNGCDTGTGGKIKVAYADGFGENVWRRVTAMEFIQQALTYPEIGHVQYSSARGDVSKAIADIQAYTAQGVDVIVVFADAGKALGPAIREAKEAGIAVVLHNGTEAGAAGTDYQSNIAENICKMGQEFVKAVIAGNPNAKSIVALGGTPGNPLSATWQDCAEKEAAAHPGVKIVARMDTNWTQEGTFTAVSAALSQYGKVDGYIYEYADGFRGAVRAYDTAKKPDDYVVATNETHSIREFLDLAFGYVNLDWKKYVEIDPRYYRPAEVDLLIGDYSKAKRQLGWEPKTKFADLVKLMVDADVKLLKDHREGRVRVTA